ncbi:prohibitin family protein [Candidatus Woesearchaeota archaeon]|nr:prohibitin family protein [Candidatus Woesearchaeota archaeon]
MPKEETPSKWPKVVSILIVIILLWSSFYTITAGYRGVLLTFGRASPVAATEGFHFKLPLIQSVVKMSVQTQKYTTEAEAASKDLQVVHSQIAVNYRIIPENAPEIYTKLGLEFEDRIIQPAVQEGVKAITAQFTAEELVTKRADVKNKIQTQLSTRLHERGVIVEELSITDFDFSESFNVAIEQKVTAEQLKLKAERDLDRIKIEAQQAEAQAIGFQKAAVAQAEGEAKAILIVKEQIGNANYLEWLKIQKWDGQLPKVTGGATPFIDVGTITQTK